MNKKELQKLEKYNLAKDFLINNLKLKANEKLFIKITKISSNGMSRRMEVFIFRKNKYTKKIDLNNITYYIGQLCCINVNDNGLLIQGCGMDMTFWLVELITYYLFEKGKTKNQIEKIKEKYRGNGGSCMNWDTF